MMPAREIRPAEELLPWDGASATFLFLVNPSSGRTSVSQKLRLVAGMARQMRARSVTSMSERHAAQVAREAMRAGEIVVACGGDGFQNVVAQQAVETGGLMTVLPMGRGNDFAASLGIGGPADTEAAIRGRHVHHARYTTLEFADRTRICVTCAGVGLLSEASFRAARLPVLQGKPLYVVAALISLMRLRCHGYSVALDGRKIAEDLLILVAAASERTGGGIKIAPRARARPDLLNVLYATRVGRAEALRLLLKALSGKHLDHPKVQNSFQRQCRIECETDAFCASLVYGDGEYLGALPVTLRLGTNPLRILVPPPRQ